MLHESEGTHSSGGQVSGDPLATAVDGGSPVLPGLDLLAPVLCLGGCCHCSRE